VRTAGSSGLRLWLFRGDVAAQALGIRLSTDAVCLRVLDRGRVTLDPDTEGYTEVQRLFVGEPELPRELVDPDLLGHLLLGSFFSSQSSAGQNILPHMLYSS
jgi:hypothetical protein